MANKAFADFAEDVLATVLRYRKCSYKQWNVLLRAKIHKSVPKRLRPQWASMVIPAYIPSGGERFGKCAKRHYRKCRG